MPRELSPAEERAFARYEALGTPEELQRLAGDNEKLKSENADRRQKVKDLEGELTTAKAAVPEGATVLTGDDAKALEALTAAGMKLGDVPTVLQERDALKAKDALRTREDGIRAAVRAHGWPDETVATLLDMRSLEGAVFEVKTEKVDDKGKQVDGQVPYVTLAGEGQKPQKLAEFAAASPQLKGLRTEASSGAGAGSGGTPWPAQGSGSSGPQGATPTAEQLASAKRAGGEYAM